MANDIDTEAPKVNTGDNPMLPCPKVEWVQHPLLDEYLKLSADPKTAFKPDGTAYGRDHYKLDNGDQQLGVYVKHGKDPHKVEDVETINKSGKTHGSVSDFYKEGHRWRATFQVLSPTEDFNIATGRADFAAPAKNQKEGYVQALSGGITDYRGLNVFFSSKFDDHGHMTEFDTVKDDKPGYTPDVCKD